MDVFEIVKSINEHHEELENKGISVVMAVHDGKKRMCMCSTGNMLDQLRCAASILIAMKKSFVSRFSLKMWDKVWNEVMAEQVLNIALMGKREEKDNADE
ncbi:MAG: hypothetical protein IJU51_04575 [Clostridia bacterium]|nr:hypothetical protein [Clostridia bacterium]